MLFGADFHGNERAYVSFFERAARSDVQLVVLGGDLLPHPRGSGSWIEQQRGFLRGWLAASLRSFRERAPDTPVFAMLGNDDFGACAEALEELGRVELLLPLHDEVHAIDDGWIAGYACVPVTPFAMSDWDRYDAEDWVPPLAPDQVLLSDGGEIRQGSLSELRARPTIEDDLDALAARSDPRGTICVAHTPPFGTKLDVMHDGGHIGSPALREFIEREQPPLSLHGHIHESPERTGSIVDRLGRTVCVNPGSSNFALRAAFLDTEDPEGTLRRVTNGDEERE